jgi:hypothetical protein
MPVEVVLDIYSGRENPKWHLDRAGVAELERLFGHLQERTNELPQPPALGYRGFHLHAVNEKLPARITVFQGIVQTEKGNFHDPGRELETWLIHKSRAVVDPPTYSYLESLISK